MSEKTRKNIVRVVALILVGLMVASCASAIIYAL